MTIRVRKHCPRATGRLRKSARRGFALLVLFLLLADAAGSFKPSAKHRQASEGHRQNARELHEPEAAQGDGGVAERAFEEARRLRSQWKADALRLSISRYREAASHWRADGDRWRQARALLKMGEVHGLLGENSEALALYREALKLSRTTDDDALRIEALNNACAVHAFQGESAQALSHCDEALRLSRATGDRRGEAQALNNTGEAHYFSDLKRALTLFEQSSALWRTAGDRRGEAQALNNIGYVYADWSDLQQAESYFAQALEGWRAAGDLAGEAQTVNALGVVHSKLGEHQKALASHARARELFRAIGSPPGELTALTGIGYVYDTTGEKAKALDCYAEALRLSRATGRREGELVLLVHVGNIHEALKNKEEALKNYEAALALSRALGDTRMEAYAFNFVGRLHDASGETKRALTFYRRALSLSRAAEDRRGEASVLYNLGQARERAGDRAAALDHYQSALALHLATRDQHGEAATRYAVARARRDGGGLEEARAQMETALGIVESLRTNVAGQELRLSYFASVQQFYGLYIDILMRAHKLRPADGLDAEAFRASERARARGLLDLLAEARADIRQAVEPSLRDKERALRQTLNAKAERQVRLLGGRHTAEEAAALAKEYRDLSFEYEELKAQIREQSPRYAALTQPQPSGVADVRRMLDEETALLEYALGDERSYLWVVTKTGITSYELPDRATIENAARSLYDLLAVRQPAGPESSALDQARGVEADAQLARHARELGGMIIEPALPQLGAKRLMVVADGALLYIPFGVLAANLPRAAHNPQTPGDAGEGGPILLLLEYEIVNLPSASALALIRSGAAALQTGRKAVAVLADPVFEHDDPRIEFAAGGRAASENSAPAVEARRALRGDALGGVEGRRLPRLLASGEEAEAIMKVVPRGAGYKAVGFGANLGAVRDPRIGQYRVVHFATHGVFNDEHPELSGIVLSLFDERGQPQDGFLRLQEVYNLSLPVELVVLSACSTGRGKEVRGEGLVGLTRGFMYAGAAGVVASLWKVDDDATAVLMRNFYAGMLQEGLPPSTALRNAQLTMRRHERWHAPYYWAGFVLHGEYRAGEASDEHRFGHGPLVAAGVVVLLASLIGLHLLRRRKILARATGRRSCRPLT